LQRAVWADGLLIDQHLFDDYCRWHGVEAQMFRVNHDRAFGGGEPELAIAGFAT
jgi:hypothetical protein